MTKVLVVEPDSKVEVDLKDPSLAAILAWLWPGLGHIYQGRTAKGVLFMTCILGTFFFGLWMGDSKVVYASMPFSDRLPYVCQLGAGVVSLPAAVQLYRVRSGKDPLWNGFMAPLSEQEAKDVHKNLHRYFELGTVYTMIAGLLNILVVYDAFGGPVQLIPEKEEKDPEPKPDAAPKPAQ